jgi:hypothetical protein
MAVNKSVTKHGTFIYEATATSNDYGSIEATVAALQQAGMTHAWVRIHGIKPVGDPKPTQALIDGLKSAGINVAGWGWCQGADIKAEARLAKAQLTKFGLNDYVADIEQGVNNANWTAVEIGQFLNDMRSTVTGALVVSTFPLIDWHEPNLMTAADPNVDAFAPQVYWMGFPDRKMLKSFSKPGGDSYTAGDPVSYAELCLDRWTGLTTKPLILTGQSYWGEGGVDQSLAQEKLDAFLGEFNLWPRIIALNWWHFGGRSAMSHHMLDAITAANLATKPYRVP